MFEGITSWISQNPEQCIILVLFVLSEALGSMDRFKSSSVFQLLIIILRGMLSKTKFGVFAGDTETEVKTTTLIQTKERSDSPDSTDAPEKPSKGGDGKK